MLAEMPPKTVDNITNSGKYRAKSTKKCTTNCWVGFHSFLTVSLKFIMRQLDVLTD